MIINHTITATNPEEPLSWQPQTLFQATLLTAILVTLLSYQATSVVYDLLLGLKPKHQASAPHLHSLLLTDESSPLSILAAILRLDPFDQLRFRLPSTTKFTRVKQSVSKRTFICLILLLAAAPIINVISVFLAIETDSVITFAQANVKLSLSADEHYVRQYTYASRSCDRLEDSLKGDTTAQFYLCRDSAIYNPLFDQVAIESKIRVVAGVQGDIRAEIFIKGANATALLNRHAEVSIHPKTFRLAHSLNATTIDTLATRIAETVEQSCDLPDQVTLLQSESPPPGAPPPSSTPSASSASGALPSGSTRSPTSRSGPPPSPQRQIVRQLAVSRLISEVSLECETVQPDGRVGIPMILAADRMLTELVTVVDVDNFLLAEVRAILNTDVDISPAWIRGDDLPVTTTRAPTAPVFWIAIAVAVVMVLRLVIERFTNNDVADGVEAVVAAGLGFQDGYEAIRCDHLLKYNHKLQQDARSHYGAARSGWEEVNDFSHAVGVLWEDEESHCYDGETGGKLDHYDVVTLDDTVIDDVAVDDVAVDDVAVGIDVDTAVVSNNGDLRKSA